MTVRVQPSCDSGFRSARCCWRGTPQTRWWLSRRNEWSMTSPKLSFGLRICVRWQGPPLLRLPTTKQRVPFEENDRGGHHSRIRLYWLPCLLWSQLVTGINGEIRQLGRLLVASQVSSKADPVTFLTFPLLVHVWFNSVKAPPPKRKKKTFDLVVQLMRLSFPDRASMETLCS